jgi:RHS repeat-associated protein
MRSRWTVRGVVVTLAAALAPLGVAPGVASAEGPSVPLPETKSVPTQQATHTSRGADEASGRETPPNQDPQTSPDGSGDVTATSLSPSATWDVAAHTGDFSWEYPLRVPPAPGGLEPGLALSYRSSAVDGRTSATNNQASWIGDGWDMWPGFVERSYGGCFDDGVKVGDLCWRTDNAVAAYGDGGGGQLICCDSNGKWHAKREDGSRIERLSGASNGDEGSADQDRGEHWRITTLDGTQYWFGSQTDSNSTWTVPVFGDDAGEPCNKATFEASHCVQAYRWNLDKVVDRNGNVIRYFYDVEHNKYGMNLKDAGVTYVRGGALRRIDYGMNERVPGGRPAAQVEFVTKDRCLPNSDCRVEKPGNWPDTPLDMRCDTTCAQNSPSFWSTKRLDTITTKVWRGSAYEPVDRWTLTQRYPDPGSEILERAALWLKEIRHTGLAGGSLDMPPVTFEGTQLPNRVDGDGDGYSGLHRYRVTGIVSESGGWLSIGYEEPNCGGGQQMPAPEHNTLRCYPVKWAPPGHAPRTDYFHKYVVASITQSDSMSTSTQTVTRYEYLDGAGWHWNTAELVSDENKTWNEFRGFKRVRVRSGAPTDPGDSPVSMTEERYYRGMHGDRLPNGTRSETVPDSDNRNHDDHDWLSGFAYESTTYAHEKATGLPKDDPPVISRTITDPAWRGPIVSRGPLHSYFVGTGTERGFTAVKAGPWRVTQTTTSYDSLGLPVSVSDLGDLAVATDDQCTTTTYAQNTGTWVMDTPATEETVAVACGTAARFPEHAISATRYGYDDRGNAAKTEIAKDRTPAEPVYVTKATAVHDVHGRLTSHTDALDGLHTIGYTPKEGGPVTGMTETTPATATLPGGLVTTTTLDPAHGNPTMMVDPNERVTETAYDALGRRAEVWLPNRPKSGNKEGSVEFTYLVRRDAPSVITTTKVGPNGVRTSSNAFFDGWSRPRQTQAPAAGGGRLITDTRYDTQGRVYKSTQPYFNTGAVDTNLWFAADDEVPGLVRNKYDGAGRVVEATQQFGAIDRWTSKTAYDGDRVHSMPPAGGTVTTTVVDAQGRTVELRQYHGTTPDGAHDSTRYKYALGGQLAEVTGPDNAIWRFSYDLRGRRTVATDPDAGTATMSYDNSDRVVSTTDAMGKTLVFGYDELGRKTEARADSVNGKLLVRWAYDTSTSGKGLLASATRYTGDNGEHAYTESVGTYSALNKPMSTSITIPSVEGALAGTYEKIFTYKADGAVSSETYPAVAAAENLASQTVNYKLDHWGRPVDTRTGEGTLLVAKSNYTRYGELERIEQGSFGNRAWQSFYYDTNTRRPNRSIVDAEVPAPMQSDVQYTHDQVGTVTSAADVTLEKPADIQCFRHDHLNRLTEAWTAAKGNWSASTGCTAGPAMADGPAPYWQSYRYDKGGNRVGETQRLPNGSAERTYTYPAQGGAQPHTVRAVAGPAGTETYGYNANGQTTSRSTPGGAQTMSWDHEGHLAAVVGTDGTTSFVNSANGERLLRRDPTGTTLYLGKQEVRASGGKVTVTRYYTHGDKTIAMARGGGLTWLAADNQGTTHVAIDTETMSVTRRRQLPFGAPRGPEAVWPDEHGFVGGVQDKSTGLTHIGAREYDPALGRFISADPLMDKSDAQQMHGYAYGNSNPITNNDATGLACSGPDGIGCRHKTSKEGYGDQRVPENKARYERHRTRWQDNSKAAQQGATTLRNNNGVRCADGVKTCPRASGSTASGQRFVYSDPERPPDYTFTFMVETSGADPYMDEGGFVYRDPLEVSPDKALAELRRCFNCSFPIAGAPEHFPGAGETLPLTVFFGLGDASLKSYPREDGFTFVTGDNHFDGAGSVLKFSFSNNQKGQLQMTVNAWTTDAPLPPALYKISPYIEWENFAEQLGDNIAKYQCNWAVKC